MRLQEIQRVLNRKGIEFRYSESNDCGAIEFVRNGLAYHIWEYPEPDRGISSNIRTHGRMEDFEDDYEKQIIDILKRW